MSKKPNDAEKVAALAGIFQQTNQRHTAPPPALPEPVEAEPAPAIQTAPQAAPKRAKSKPLSKRTDPDWHHFGVYLRKKTHKRARRKLEDSEPDKDMSDLIETLLQQYLESM